MTAQEVFDAVVAHLRKQGAPCMDEWSDMCAYRYGGMKCAAGAIIRDDEYREEMEGRDVYNLFANGMLPERLNPHVRLLAKLQLVHDSCRPRTWERELRRVAGAFGLTMPEGP